MFSTGLRYFFILIIAFSAPRQGELFAQVEIVDTTEYMHSDTEEALDFNLLVASAKGYDLEVERLLKLGADINTASDMGATPLLFAVANGHLSTVKILLSNNPEIDKATFREETPLIIAVKNQNSEIAEALIRKGADVNKADIFGATPIHYASISGYFYIVDMLLYYNADCNVKSSDGTTPLMASVWSGFPDIADLLVQNGANLEARDNEGFTPFLIASQFGDTLMMNYFLRMGVDLYEKNKAGYNALDLAVVSGSKPAVEYLLSRGDKWTSPEANGKNPYQVALDYNKRDIFSILKSENLPGKPGYSINEGAIWAGAKFNRRDIYTGVNISFKESRTNLGISAGFDSKLWYTRVLVKQSENTFYQYYNTNSIIFAGLFRDFALAESQSGIKISAAPAVSVAYSFGNKLKGTDMAPSDRLLAIPSINIKVQKNRLILSAAAEYMKSDFYRIGPVWFRAGISYEFLSQRLNSPEKKIKWF